MGLGGTAKSVSGVGTKKVAAKRARWGGMKKAAA